MLRLPVDRFSVYWLVLVLSISCLVSKVHGGDGTAETGVERRNMPWQEAGLTKREAAVHLINRFTFGPNPELITTVMDTGLENWFGAQLVLASPDPGLGERLEKLASLSLTNREILAGYPTPGEVRQQAIADGSLDAAELEAGLVEPAELQRILRRYSQSMGFLPQRRPVEEIIAAKLIRAVHVERQVTEVMVDFWYNHFYVSARDDQCRRFVGTYERDAIRPYVFEDFRAMLGATAKHPAMLLYLDNARSTASLEAPTTTEMAREGVRRNQDSSDNRFDQIYARELEQRIVRQKQMMTMPSTRSSRRGLNENYARELLELHTLGVDQGYSQEDVIAATRVLTGWTHVPPDPERREKLRERIRNQLRKGRDTGWVIDGDFLFNPDLHDAGSKQVLGVVFAPGGGMAEGEQLLDLLARHPATAEHVAYKLCVRFVADEPRPALVTRVAGVFRAREGDLREVLWAIVAAPEFWSTDARRAKVKSPFEYAASAVRALDGQVQYPRPLIKWINRMGQPLYRHAAPTGFPDQADYWLSAGSLVTRMQFGLALAAGKIRGVQLDPTLTGGDLPRDADLPGTAEGLLRYYSGHLLPECDPAPFLASLDLSSATMVDRQTRVQITGVLLASPEFQRR